MDSRNYAASGKNMPATDLAVDLHGTRDEWLWTEIKRIRPRELGETRGYVLSDVDKLDRMARAHRKNLPQAILLILMRAAGTEEATVDFYWDMLNTNLGLGSWDFVDRRHSPSRFSEAVHGEMMIGLWARHAL